MCFVLTSNTDSSFSNQKHPLISAKFVRKLLGLKEHWRITRNETTLFKALALYCTLFSPLKNIDHFSFFIFSFKGVDGWVQALIKNSIINFFLHPFPIHLFETTSWALIVRNNLTFVVKFQMKTPLLLADGCNVNVTIFLLLLLVFQYWSCHFLWASSCWGLWGRGWKDKVWICIYLLNRDLYIWSQVNVNDESPLHVLHYSTQIYHCKKAQSVRPWQHPEQASNWGPILSWVISSARQVCSWQNQGLHRIGLAGNR